MNKLVLHGPSSARGKVFWIDNFISSEQCAAILDELRFAFWEPSSVSVKSDVRASQNVLSRVRVSLTTDQSWFTPPLCKSMRIINQRIENLVPRFMLRSEPWQATRYGRGGHFDYHLDAGHWGHEQAGDRNRTVLIYLNTPRRGGNTYFRQLDIEVKAKAGRLLIWKNLSRDGNCDPEMIHCSGPLIEGSKTILVTWVRQRMFR